jgi:hypothetical protein
MTPMHPMPTSTVFVALTFGAAWVAWFVVMIAAKIAARTRIVAEPSATDPETVELGKVRDDESLSSNVEEDISPRTLFPRLPYAQILQSKPYSDVNRVSVATLLCCNRVSLQYFDSESRFW